MQSVRTLPGSCMHIQTGSPAPCTRINCTLLDGITDPFGCNSQQWRAVLLQLQWLSHCSSAVMAASGHPPMSAFTSTLPCLMLFSIPPATSDMAVYITMLSGSYVMPSHLRICVGPGSSQQAAVGRVAGWPREVRRCITGTQAPAGMPGHGDQTAVLAGNTWKASRIQRSAGRQHVISPADTDTDIICHHG